MTSTDTLVQTIWISLAGMTLTFGAVGILVAMMFLLTRVLRDRPDGPGSGDDAGEVAIGTGVSDDIAQAAAAAVSLALDARAARAGVALGHGGRGVVVESDVWDVHARASKVNARATYESMR
jgi:Na+-transporting methylmalonyl-CoA/oxaloacetate decarboxylase gamma subunit